MVVERTHWDVFAFDWIHQEIRVEILVWGRYTDWEFLDWSGLLLKLSAGVGKRSKSAVVGQERLEIEYFVLVLVEG